MEGEFFHEARKRSKELQCEFPHHGTLDWLLIQTFYNGSNNLGRFQLMQSLELLLWGTDQQIEALLEGIASNNYHWAIEQRNPKEGGRHNVDALTMLVSKVEALF